jgi:hypothetical protein
MQFETRTLERKLWHADRELVCLAQGLVQSAFLWGYMATPLIGGTLADEHGGMAAFTANSCLGLSVKSPPLFLCPGCDRQPVV